MVLKLCFVLQAPSSVKFPGGEGGGGGGAGLSPISPASNSRSKSKELIIHVIWIQCGGLPINCVPWFAIITIW